ncbi:MAG: DUF4214 domain-containing protein [Clostridiales bacterium]|nr:DUF4214 domain-containing protein [Clostridiales bacterium]
MRRPAKALSVALTAAMALTAVPLWGSDNKVNASQPEVNSTNFPDPNFLAFVSEYIDQDHNGVLDGIEIRQIQYLDISNRGIETLQGIEFFDFLTDLNCSYNELTSLSVTGNTSLQKLVCSDNQLTSLDVSGLEYLQYLDCNSNLLPAIDVSSNVELEWLDCRYNELTSIDISHNGALYCFQCRHNHITSIDVSQNEEMKYLWVGENPLTSIDVSDLNALEQLGIDKTDISELDISDNPRLVNLSVWGADLSVLDISNNPRLLYLQCQENNLTTLDLTGHDNLLALQCSDNNLTSIDVTRCTRLWQLECDGNDLSETGLDVSNNPELFYLHCHDCGLINIDISNNPRMIRTYLNGDGRFYYFYPETTDVYCLDETIDDHTFTYTFTIDKTMTVTYGNEVPGHRTPPIPEVTSAPSESQYEVIPTPVITPRAAGRGDYGTGVEGFVGRLYGVALGRNADPEGCQNWIDTIRSGENTGADVARGFLYSQEFLGKDISNEEFVRTLYRTFFDREADEGGLNAWVAALNNGESKENIIEGFINSAEWSNVCVSFGIPSGGTGVPTIEVEPNQETIDFATRLYTTCLGRDADEAGLMAWARQLANQRDTGTGAARGFFFSYEFTNQNVSNEEYVNRLYRTFMGREADEAGFSAWVGQLDNGTSREEVFNGFAQSQEFGQICASYGIIR